MMTPDTIEDLLDRMRADLTVLTQRGDARRFFHATYLRTTQTVADELGRGGFADGGWVERWDVAFAQLYLDALDAENADAPVSEPWRVAFDAAQQRADLPPLHHVLLGLNAHINYDLPQALTGVISSADFDNPVVLQRRRADHRHLDTVLQSRVAAEGAEIGAVSKLTLLDRIMLPLNRIAGRRLLAEARAKVWRNAEALDRARRIDPTSHADALAELERRCAARVRDLTAPGPLLINLARRGFGVLLPSA
jgi:hypothetical protein